MDYKGDEMSMSITILKAITMLNDFLKHSQRIGSDEIYDIQKIIRVLKESK